MTRDGSLVRVGFQNNVLSTSQDAVYVEIGRTHDGDIISAWFPKSATRVGPRGEVMVPSNLVYQHRSDIVETPHPRYREWR